MGIAQSHDQLITAFWSAFRELWCNQRNVMLAQTFNWGDDYKMTI